MRQKRHRLAERLVAIILHVLPPFLPDFLGYMFSYGKPVLVRIIKRIYLVKDENGKKLGKSAITSHLITY